jgi:hypothetical protein
MLQLLPKGDHTFLDILLTNHPREIIDDRDEKASAPSFRHNRR